MVVNDDFLIDNLCVSAEQNYINKLNNIKMLSGLVLSLEERIQIDNCKIKDGTFNSDDLLVSSEMLNFISEMSGFKIQKISTENLKSRDLKISLEELDSEKQSLLSRISKVWFDMFDDIKHNNTEVVALWNLNVKKKSTKIEELLLKIKNKELKFKNSKITSDLLNSNLGIYFEMNREFNIKDFLEFIQTPQNLILKEGLFKQLNKFGYDQLVVSKGNEDKIPVHNSSVNFIDKIKDKNIRKWLDKDTKWAIAFPIVGKRIEILSLCQNEEEGAYTNMRKFNIDESVYTNKTVEIKSESDFNNIIKTVEHMLSVTDDINRELKTVKTENLSKFIKSELATLGYVIIGGLFSIRRILRQIDARVNFYGYALFASYKLANNHLDILDIVYTILINSTEKNK